MFLSDVMKFSPLQIDARSDKTGEVIYKDNFSTAIAGIVEVSEVVILTCKCAFISSIGNISLLD